MFTKPVNAPSVSTSPLLKRVLDQEILKLHFEASSVAFVEPLELPKSDQICLQNNNNPLPPFNPPTAIIFRPARQMALCVQRLSLSSHKTSACFLLYSS